MVHSDQVPETVPVLNPFSQNVKGRAIVPRIDRLVTVPLNALVMRLESDTLMYSTMFVGMLEIRL